MGRDQLKTAGQLATEQLSCGRTVFVPPVGRLANLPLGVPDNEQTKAQYLVPELVQELPTIDNLSSLGLRDGLPKQRLLALGEPEAFFSFGHKESDDCAFLKAALGYIQPSVYDLGSQDSHDRTLPQSPPLEAFATHTSVMLDLFDELLEGHLAGRYLPAVELFEKIGTDSKLSQSTLSTARNASWGMSTLPTRFIRFLPSFWRSISLRLRVMSPP